MLNLRSEFLFDAEQIHAIVVSNKIHGDAQVTETAGSTDSVQVRLRILREVEVDDDVDGLNIDTASEEIRRHQVAASAVAEVVEDAVAVRLNHLGVNVEARISKFGDFPSEQLYASDAVTENDGLVDLKFAEEGVQAVHLLLFFDEGVVLGDTLQRELFHEIDNVRLTQILVLEVLHRDRESGGVQQYLSVLRHEVDHLGDDGLEFG